MMEIIKKNKGFLPSVILFFAVSFSVFIYEPLIMYANNIEDFWFDFYILLGPSVLFSLITFLCLSCIFFVIYLIAKKSKRLGIYYVSVTILDFCFICAYIHSNFLAGFLPSLDGSVLDWSDPIANIVSIVVCLVLIAVSTVCLVKLKPRKTAKYCSYTVCVILIMLFASMMSTFVSTDIFTSKGIVVNSTEKNLNLISDNKNYLVFLVDAVDSVNFDRIVKGNSEYQLALKDFSYFPDTVSGYAFTRDSIPFIFSGKWNKNETSFPEYSTTAFDNSEFFDRLSKNDYNKNFYDLDFIWNSAKAFDFDNIIAVERNPKKRVLFKQEIKYYLYKAMPFPLKRFSKIDTLDFSATQSPQEYSRFNCSDVNFYHNYLRQPLLKTNQKYFQYIHIEGGHVPFDVNKDVEQLANSDGTYEDKLEATMKIIDVYLQRLKDNDAYDNATIVILADHGYWYADSADRSNPVLYVKGQNEKHSKMHISDKQVSYADLSDMFIELLDGRSSTEIFGDIPTEGRTRRYILNQFNHEEHMEEYEQTDKAWNIETLKPTGKVFDL